MTVPHIEESTITALIRERYPMPLNVFEEALYYEQLKFAFENLFKAYTDIYNSKIDLLINSEDENYKVEQIIKIVPKVDIPTLKQEHPEIYQNLVYIKSFDAEKILSRRWLYNQAKLLIGDDIEEFEKVNITDVEKVIPKAFMNDYLVFENVPKGYHVVEKINFSEP